MQPREGEFFQIFYQLIALALQRTCHLETLNLILPLDQECCYILGDVFLPNLLELSLLARSTSHLSCFLNRHPRIHSLRLGCQARDYDYDLRMPALISFTGLHFMVPNIAATASCIRQINITWDNATDEEYDDSLKSLALLPITSMGCAIYSWNIRLFEGIGRHVPQLEHLVVLYTINPTDAVSGTCRPWK